MRVRYVIPVLVVLLAGLGGLYAQRPWREYPAIEYENFPIPPDAHEKTEFTFARMIYPSIVIRGRRWPYWTMDYPRADRHFLQGVRRLTRIHTRSVEQPVDLEDPADPNDVFNWPWLYAVEVGHWDLTDGQCKKFREFLLRGGFFVCDDFHGTQEWDIFTASMKKAFPDRPIVDIDPKDPIWHVIYDLDHKIQVPGAQYFESGRIYEHDGYEPKWRGIYDDKGRLMMAICHNQDNGDAWEWSDDPRYHEEWASQAYRMGVNYVVYAMTH